MSIEENVANRKAANAAADEVLELAQAAVENLPPVVQVLFWERLFQAVQAKQPGCGTAGTTAVAGANCQHAPEVSGSTQAGEPQAGSDSLADGYHLFDATVPPDVEAALELVDSICELADDSPSWCQDFAEDVRDKARDVGETIERTQRVTAKQQVALENWKAALGRQVSNYL